MVQASRFAVLESPAILMEKESITLSLTIPGPGICFIEITPEK
jgi:hypothetical protein